jgi:hypothetical protein
MIPGIFGFVGCTTDEDARSRLLQEMARALAPQDAPRADLYCDKSIGFGRVSLR